MTHAMRIVKMSGAGNDFVVLGPEEAQILGEELAAWTRKVCRRGLSVGADGVLVVEPAGPERVRVRFRNPDGGEAFCGNGSRCAARYAFLRGFAEESMVLETQAGEVPARVFGSAVRLTLPFPRDRGPHVLEREGARLEGRHVLAGVPHFVVFVEDLPAAPLEGWGPWIRGHALFGAGGTNVDLIQWLPNGSLGIRTWERGVEAETLACGTGALAAAAVAYWQGTRGTLSVVPASGVPLVVGFEERSGLPESLLLEGDARVIFEGTLPAEATSGFPSC